MPSNAIPRKDSGCFEDGEDDPLGGMANLWGAILTSMVLNFLSLRGYFGSYDDAVFGLILVVMMLFAPQGILVKRSWKLSMFGKHRGNA